MRPPRGTTRKYHYFYKITNTLNGHFYYGVHNTDNLDDGYMGSGTRLKYAYKKYGIEFFEKEILKFFNTAEEAFNYEAEVVTEELVHDTNCYNISCGGGPWKTIGTTAVRDKDGNIFRVDVNDPRYLSGKLVGVTKGFVAVKDKDGNIFRVDVNDPRYLSGVLKPVWCGKHHTQEAIKKCKETCKRIGHQQGEKNSHYGKVWVMKNDESICIPKEKLQEYIDEGWKKGRKCCKGKYINVNNGKEYKLIRKEKLQEYIDEGWKKGRGKKGYIKLENDIK